MKIKNPHQILVGNKYKITEPCYDDYIEGLKPETYVVEVISKKRFGFILKDIENDFTFERTFQHLINCKIEEYEN